MSHKLHSNARTTPKLREEIHHAEGSAVALARRYNVTAPTIIKWQGRDDFTDRSHRPHKLNTTLDNYCKVYNQHIPQKVLELFKSCKSHAFGRAGEQSPAFLLLAERKFQEKYYKVNPQQLKAAFSRF